MLWIKAFHIIFVVTWFAGLFYLPRLYVYHAMSDDAISDERFKVMERKLFYGIMTPSAVLAVGLGIWLWVGYWWQAFIAGDGMGWLHAKLTLVVILLVFHGYCWKYLQDFKHNRNRHGHVFYRWFNEFPVVILIVTVILVVVKPF